MAAWPGGRTALLSALALMPASASAQDPVNSSPASKSSEKPCIELLPVEGHRKYDAVPARLLPLAIPMEQFALLSIRPERIGRGACGHYELILTYSTEAPGVDGNVRVKAWLIDATGALNSAQAQYYRASAEGPMLEAVKHDVQHSKGDERRIRLNFSQSIRFKPVALRIQESSRADQVTRDYPLGLSFD